MIHHNILENVQIFLASAARGEARLNDEQIEKFGENCKEILKRSFTEQEEREYTHRMSGVGRPVCQQQWEKVGAKPEAMDYATKMKLLIGDVIESLAIVIMEGAGVPITAEQKPVEVNVGGITLKGTLDLEVGDEAVYDIKSASPYSFSKFDAPNAFELLKNDDPFGYIAQGYLYSEGTQKPLGGWIVINKSSGEWAVLNPPAVDNAYRKEALRIADYNIRSVDGTKSEADITRCFEPVEETFYQKKTGNRYLGVTCSYCPFKHKCWESEGELVLAPQPASKAKVPKKYWYIGQPQG